MEAGGGVVSSNDLGTQLLIKNGSKGIEIVE